MDSFWEHLQNLTDAKAIISFGFYFLLVVVFAETGLFFGFFLPGDYLLFLSGLLCSNGTLDIPVYVLVLSLIGAGVLGNYTGYWFGYRAGPKLFSRSNSFFFKQRHVKLAEDFYLKYGGMALVLGRFFPIIRTFAPIFAGVVKVDLRKFTVYNIIGCFAWVNIFTLAGYFLGRRYPQIKDYIQYIVVGFIVVTTIPLVIAFLRQLFHKRSVKELK